MPASFPVADFPAILGQFCSEAAHALLENEEKAFKDLLFVLAEVGAAMNTLFPTIPLPLLFSGEQNIAKPPMVIARYNLEDKDYREYYWLKPEDRSALASCLNAWADYYAREARQLYAVQELLSAVREAQSPTPDGPHEVGRFCANGKEHPFPPLQWRLLHFLHAKGNVPIEDVLDELYPGEGEAADGKFRKLITDTNKRLFDSDAGYEIERPMKGYLALTYHFKKSYPER